MQPTPATAVHEEHTRTEDLHVLGRNLTLGIMNLVEIPGATVEKEKMEKAIEPAANHGVLIEVAKVTEKAPTPPPNKEIILTKLPPHLCQVSGAADSPHIRPHSSNKEN